MTITRTYDPAETMASFLGNFLTAFGPDAGVSVTYNEETYTIVVGASGEVTRVRNRNASGRITVTLLGTSPENDVLSNAAKLDKATNQGVGAFMVKDRFGTTLVMASEAWIVKIPDLTRAKEAPTVEWVFECGNLDVFIGGTYR
jgi:hypothetical protein